jgi:hypothetical protein
MSAMLERSEQATAWELRGYWAARRRVALTLTSRCMISRVEGLIERVSVTGAFVVFDGRHIPTVDILAVARPHHSQPASESYRRTAA